MLKIVRRGRLITLTVCSVLLCVPAAHAQETSDRLPDPISTAEMNQLLQKYVHPSKEQDAAVVKLFDAYKERFRALRDDEIARFLSKMKDMQNPAVATKEPLDSYLKSLEHVNKKITEVDDALFDEIASLMGEEGLDSVNRARNARARVRMGSSFLQSLDWNFLSGDVAEIALGLGLTLEERQKIEPALIAYEQRLTNSMKDLVASRLLMVWDVEAAKTGMHDPSYEELVNDTEHAIATRTAYNNAIVKAAEPFTTKCAKFAEFNFASFKAISEQLPDEAKRKFRNKFMYQAYAEIERYDLPTDALFRKALRSKTMAEPALQAIKAAYRTWMNSDDALVDQAVKKINATQALLYREMGRQIDDGFRDRQKISTNVRKARMELGLNALKSLAPLMDNPRLKELIDKAPDEMFNYNYSDRAIDSYVDGAPPASDKAKSASKEFNERSPVSADTIEWIAAQLSLDESQKTLLQTMHSDYRGSWNDSLKDIFARMNAARAAYVKVDKNSGSQEMDQGAEYDRLVARRELFKQATDLDAAFFNDMALGLGERAAPVLKMAKLERALDRTADASFHIYGLPWSVTEQPANIAMIVRTSELTPQDQAKLRGAIVAQADSLMATLIDFYSAYLGLEIESQDLMKQFPHGFSQDDYKKVTGTRWDLSVRSGKRHLQHLEAIRTAWRVAIEPLDAAQRSAMQTAYEEHAYPFLFLKDPYSPLQFIQKAIVLNDLTDEQRTRLRALADSAHAEHVALGMQMIPARSTITAMMALATADSAKFTKIKTELAEARGKIRYERNEKCQKAIQELRRILTEDQATEIKLANYDKIVAKQDARTKEFGES